MKKIHARRAFLNTDKSKSAHIITDIQLDTWKNAKKVEQKEITASIDIADCSRKVTLDFSIYSGSSNGVTKKQIKENLKKLELLQQEIDIFAQKYKSHIESTYVNEDK